MCCAPLFALTMSRTSWAQEQTFILPTPAPDAFRVYDIYQPLRRNNYDQALAAAVDNPAAYALIEWKRAQDEAITLTLDEAEDLVVRFSDWPRLDDIFENIERALAQNSDHIEVLDWFTRYPATTGLGKLRHGEALLAKAFVTEGTNSIRTGWIEANLSQSETRTLYGKYQSSLRAEDHEARLDRLLWARQWPAARAMYPYVSDGWRALAEARSALSHRRGNVDGMIRRVPEELQDHPGLMFERTRWRRRAGLHDGARDLLLQMDEFNVPDWVARRVWIERRFQARETLDANEPEIAYRLAARHGAVGGSAFADGEFMSGWIALRYLDRPARARDHFIEMWNGVSFPISRSRAAYWAGRAFLVLDEPANAQRWFELAARYHRTFYGQLAMLQLAEQPVMPGPVIYAPDEVAQQKLQDDPRARAAILAHWFDWDPESRALIRHLDEELSLTLPEHHRAVFDIAAQVDGLFTQVQLAKRAIRRGHAFDDVLFPTLPIPDNAHLPADIIHAIIRQESLFNQGITSRADARGLMQILPGTGRAEARKLGFSIDANDLYDPDINVVLGSSYLKGLIDRYDGSYIMAIAAYNAGPGRVNRWIRFYGDPRTGEIDPLDWIERIPFSETRNYVHRIMENLQVYRTLINGDQTLQLADDLRRGGPSRLPVLYDTDVLPPRPGGPATN